MPPVLVVENEHPRHKLLSWTLQQEGLDVEITDPPTSVARTDARIFVLNAEMPIEERRSLVERLHGRGGRIIDLPGAGDLETDTGADAYVTTPYRAADIVRAIARLGAN